MSVCIITFAGFTCANLPEKLGNIHVHNYVRLYSGFFSCACSVILCNVWAECRAREVALFEGD